MSQIHEVGVYLAIGVEVGSDSNIVHTFLDQCDVVSCISSSNSCLLIALNKVIRSKVRKQIDCLRHLNQCLVTLVSSIRCVVLKSENKSSPELSFGNIVSHISQSGEVDRCIGNLEVGDQHEHN